MSKKKGSNSNTKKSNTTKIKKENIIEQELTVEDASYTFLRIIIAVILVAIIVVLSVKACKKDEKEPVKKDKKVTTTQKKVEIETTKPYVYEKKAEPINSTSVVETVIEVANTVVEEEENKDVIAPVVGGVSDNMSYPAIVISATDDTTDPENLKVYIDGKEYELGKQYDKNGKHILKVVDEAGNETEIEFIIAKFVKTREEFYDALQDEENEYIAFENDIEADEDIVISRNVKLTSKENVTLTFGMIINEGIDATLENVDIKHSNGKKIRLSGKLKIESSTVEFDSNSVVLENDESELEIENSDICLSEGHSEKSAAIVIGTGVKNTTIKVEQSNINLGDNSSSGILYEGGNDDSNLVISNSTITGSDDENPSVGISLIDQKNSNIEISSSEITGFDPSINLGENVSDCTININNSNLSGDPYIVSNDESNVVNEIEPEEENEEKEIKLLSIIDPPKKAVFSEDFNEEIEVDTQKDFVIDEEDKNVVDEVLNEEKLIEKDQN